MSSKYPYRCLGCGKEMTRKEAEKHKEMLPAHMIVTYGRAPDIASALGIRKKPEW